MTVFSIVNQVPSVGADVIFDVKGILVSSSWTVVSSSDGTTAAEGDTWLSASVGNNNYAWLQLRSPDNGIRHLSFQRSTTHYEWRIQYLSGTFNNDATATSLPTTATGTERWVFGSAGSYSELVQNAIDERHHVVSVSGSHASTGSFWFATFTKTSATVKQIFVFDPLEASFAGDLDPICIFSTYPLSYNYIGNINYGPLGDNAGTWDRFTVSQLCDSPATRMQDHGIGLNTITTKVDLVPCTYVRFSTYGGNQGLKGYSSMVLLSGYSTLAFGDTLNVEGSLDVTGSKSHVVLGDYFYATTILPWDGSSDFTI